MKSLLMLLLLIKSSLFCFSQEKIHLVTGFSSSFSKEVISNSMSQLYGELGLNVGVKLYQINGCIDISLAYEFSSNVNYYTDYDSVALVGKYHKHYDSNGNEIDNYNSLLRSHFIGASFKYIFLKRDKIIRPYLEAKLLTEISTNYKNGFLLEEEYIPKDKTWGTGQDSSPYYSTLYHSTPFVGSAILGCDFRIVENLHLNLGVGYGFRIMKTKYASWYKEDNLDEITKDISTENINSHMLDIQLGLSYAFSFKKKSDSPRLYQ